MGSPIFSISYCFMSRDMRGRDWATIGELAERLQAHHHGVVSLASRCEKLGLIYRQRGIVDKREVEIHLTPEGNKLVIKIASLHRKELLSLQGVFNVALWNGSKSLRGLRRHTIKGLGNPGGQHDSRFYCRSVL